MILEEFLRKTYKFKAQRNMAEKGLKKITEDSLTINKNTELIKVKPDGNCLIKTIIAKLIYTQNENIVTDLLLPFLDNENIQLLLEDKSKEGITKIIDTNIIKLCCKNIRTAIKTKWDYKGCPEYHMNEKAIDGLAREMILRFFCIEELTVYSLIPEEDEEFKKVININPNTFVKNNFSWKTSLLCGDSFFHYVAVL